MKHADVLMEAKKMSKRYGADDAVTHALRDVSLTIKRGEFVAIMGPSGSGKSTLMHILGFLDTPTSGEYFFEGASVHGMDDDALAGIRSTKVGFIFQSFNLLARTSVLENVMLPLLYHSTIAASRREELARKAIASVGLTDRAGYLSNQLSGGQQQRVAIARSLVVEPEVIFADEPTGNLDSVSGRQVMEILQKLHADGHTIILVTHEQVTAEHAGRIIRISDGRIASDDSAHKQRRAHATSTLK